MALLVSYLLSAVGATVLLVWPEHGLMAWFRERVLRRSLPALARDALDCYTCSGFWLGLGLGVIWWRWTGRFYYAFGGLTVAGLFWLVQRLAGREGEDDAGEEPEDYAEEGLDLAAERLAICRRCEAFDGSSCRYVSCCLATWQQFLERPDSTCPRDAF